MTRVCRASIFSIAACLLVSCASTRSHDERVERTERALAAFLDDQAAATTALELVRLCETEPNELMYVEYHLGWDPNGPERFGSLEAASATIGSAGATGVPLAQLACTREAYDEIEAMLNL